VNVALPTSSSPRSRFTRGPVTIIVSLVLGALMAAGFAAPANAVDLPTMTVHLTSTSGAPLSGVSVTLYPRSALAIDVTKSSITAPEAAPNSGDYTFTAGTISTGQEYILEFSGASGGYTQFYGNTVDPAAATGVYFYNSDHSTINASIDAGVTISGKITTPSGSAASSIYVIPYRWNGSVWQQRSESTVTTSGSGTYTVRDIDPGSYKVLFLDQTTRGYLPVYSGGTSSLATAVPTYVALGSTATVNQKLVKGGTIAGKSIYKFGGSSFGSDHMFAIAYTLLPDGAGGFSGVDKDAGYYLGESTTTSGKWTVPGLPTGTYVVKLYNDGYYDAADELEEVYIGDSPAAKYRASTWDAAHRFAVKAGSTLTRTEVTTLDFADDAGLAALQIHVQTAGSAPIGGMEVTLRSSDNEDFYFGPLLGGSSYRADASGNVEVPRLPAGDYSLAVLDPDVTPTHQPYFEEFSYDGIGTTKTVTMGSDTANGFAVLDLTPDVSNPANVVVGTEYVIDAVGNQPNSSMTYLWLRDGVPIFGATSNTYTTRSGDVGKYVTALVTVSTPGLPDNAVFEPVGTVTSGGQISNLDSVLLSQYTGVKPATVLTAAPGDWDVSKVTLSYQWYSDGNGTETTWTPIAGATSKSYTATIADAETHILVGVVASKVGYTDSVELRSDDVYVSLANALTVTKAPTVTSVNAGGSTTFTATTGSWSSTADSYTFTWFDDTHTVSAGVGVTSAAFPNDGQVNRLRITAEKSGYAAGIYDVVLRKGTAGPVLSGTPVIYQTVPYEEVVSATHPIQPDSQLFFDTSVVWTYPNSDTGGTRSWQWYRQFGSGSVSAISGATSNTYTVKNSDIGAKISVVEKSKLSTLYAGTGATAKIPAGLVVSRPTLVASPATVSISGTGTTSSTLTGSVSVWPGVTGVTQKYTWKSCDAAFGDCFISQDHYVTISGATASTFTPGASLAGFVLELEVTGSKKYFATSTIRSVPFTLNSDASTFTSLSDPVFTAGLVSGIAHVGTKITLTPATYDRPGISKQYEWQLCDIDIAVSSCAIDPDWTTVLSTTSTTYTPKPEDLGSGADYIRVRQIGSLAAGGGTRYDRSLPIELSAGIPRLIAAPKITTTSTTFTVSTGSWSPTSAFGYQWYADGVDVGGDSSVFDRTGADYSGQTIYVLVTATGGAGYDQASTIVVAAKGTKPTTIAGELTIIGDRYGDTLSVSGSPFHYAGAVDSLETLKYQWYVGSTAIKGATRYNYTPGSSIVGKSIKVKITSASSRYASSTYTTPAIVLARATIFGEPIVTGDTGITNFPGTLLSADVSGYVPSTVTKSFAWQRQAGGAGSWSTISGQSKSTYRASLTDAGANIRAVVTTKKTGYTTVSTPSDPVAVDFLESFTVVARPSLSGVGNVGTALTLDQGSTNIAGVTKTQQWYRNGALLPGVTGTIYTPLASTYLDEISAVVTYSKLGYASLSYESNAKVIGPGAAPVPSVTPSISGAPFVGGVLTANTVGSPAAVSWNVGGLTIQYNWQVDTVGPGGYANVVGGSGASLTVPLDANPDDEYRLQITVYRAGYDPYYIVTNSVFIEATS
jgi:hypothetical protein